jgi:hypothetical protein
LFVDCVRLSHEAVIPASPGEDRLAPEPTS